MFIYMSDPIDYFPGMMSIDEAAEKIREELGNDEVFKLFRLAMECAHAVSLAKGGFWEGDIRERAMYVFALPDPSHNISRYGLVWKQDNNGTTFICSPVELPWISDDRL